MGGELIANGGSDKVRAIRIEPFLYQEIDLSEIDRAEIDGDLFGVWESFELRHIVDGTYCELIGRSHCTIRRGSKHQPSGW